MRFLQPFARIGQFVVMLAASVLSSFAVESLGDEPLPSLVVGVAAALASGLLYRVLVRVIERRRVDELGVSGAAPQLFGGALGGLLLFGIVVGAIAVAGGYRIVGTGSSSAAAVQAGLMIVVATAEELAFRGVLLRFIEEWAGTWVALVATSAVFGGLHLLNPDGTLWGALAIAVEAGGMLGAAYVVTRRLWLPIGLHFGWNFAAAGVFGTAVSGTGSAPGLFEGVTAGPLLLTGGRFGPEDSLVAVVVGAVVTAVLLIVAHRRGRIVPLRSGRRSSHRPIRINRPRSR